MKIARLATLVLGVLGRRRLHHRQKAHFAMLGRHPIERDDSLSGYWLRGGMKTFNAPEPRIAKRAGRRPGDDCTYPFLCDEIDDNIVVQY